jgi:hypothetical protein
MTSIIVNPLGIVVGQFKFPPIGTTYDLDGTHRLVASSMPVWIATSNDITPQYLTGRPGIRPLPYALPSANTVMVPGVFMKDVQAVIDFLARR